MSLPDYMVISRDPAPPNIDGFSHSLILRPIDPATARQGQSAGFMIEPDCGRDALNDPALDGYLKASMPVLIFARRARDLRPFLRRADSFRDRGYAVEVVQ